MSRPPTRATGGPRDAAPPGAPDLAERTGPPGSTVAGSATGPGQGSEPAGPGEPGRGLDRTVAVGSSGIANGAAADRSRPRPSALGTPRGSVPVSPAADPARALRRLITLAVVSTILPGFAHLLVGKQRVGGLIFRTYLGLLGLGAAILVVAVLSKRFLLKLAVQPNVLKLLEYGALGLAVAWCLVIISGALLGEPGRLDQARRRIAAGSVFVLCVIVAVPLVLTARYAEAQRSLITGVFTETGGPDKLPDRLNVLLLGGDAGKGRIGVRTDSVSLASIDTTTGRTVMFSLPRNLQKVPFPAGSALAARFPNGFDCGNECLLNAIYTYAVGHRDLWPGARDPGAEAVKQAVSATLGLRVDYYVLVNLDGFKEIIDALGGVRIRVDQRVPIGGIAPDGSRVPVTRYIEPGLQRLNGYEALWYSRSRSDSDDYARMARQRCVMGAILHEADPWSVLRNYQKLASSAKNLMSTDIPRKLLPDLIDVALAAKNSTVGNLQFVPPLIKPADPDFELIRSRVAKAIDASDHPTPAPTASQSSAAGPPGSTSGPTRTATAGVNPSPSGQPVDLGSVCRYT